MINPDSASLAAHTSHGDPATSQNDPIFWPLTFRSGLIVKNRIFRSNISGQFDKYNGQGTQTRIDWETSFARGGVGCILSSYAPVHVRGRILVRYAMIDNDDKIPFWRQVGQSVAQAGKEAFPNHPTQSGDCKYIVQLSHSGRQQDVGGFENKDKKALSSTSRPDYFHGILCRAMTKREILEVIKQFGDAAERAERAGLAGVELHAANGYLFTQFLSSAINDRTDEYGGSLRGRAKFLLDVVDSIKQSVKNPDTFHLQIKTNAADYDNALYPWRRKGNTLEDAISVCNWAVEKGVDAIHVSSGSIFPHPRNPAGDLPLRDAIRMYPHIMDAGIRTRFNFWVFRNPILGPLFRYWWNKRRGIPYEKISGGINLGFATKIKQALIQPAGLPDGVKIPVLVTGGFQHARVIREAISSGKVDGVSIARPLIANRDLPKLFMSGMDWEDASYIPDENWPIENRNPCTYCNKCLFRDLNDLLGCYELSRFSSKEEMDRKIYEVAGPDFKDNELDNVQTEQLGD